ncbi:MAG: phenylacetate-CoA oxygenase/reductase subunit PaaK [Haliscomenobacteraceae bacterium CHB4]|nr:1,2-phenylacetyl-CoA epoxidase, subunit E [Saprospiraceae bacterium]MCE7923295.1 phenylacetate-CoA oxygenase/reductase subunit PaaK [Haliscomenobacteraceae bacterium CHB4]
MTKFYPLKVRDIRRETPDTVSVAFEVPEALRDTFRFNQGQHLTLRTEIHGEEVRRAYSICTAPHENDLRVAIKKVEGGMFGTFASERLKVGDTLESMPPLGHFYAELNPENRNLYVAFAAGSGITPVMSILKTTLVQEPHSRFILFYGNRGFDHIIFREQLEHLKNLYPDRLAVHHVLSRESLGSDLFNGHIDGEKCRSYARLLFRAEDVDAYFLCGPEEMIFSVKEALEKLGVAPKRIHFELFTTSGAKKQPATGAAKKESFDASVTVIQDGAQFDFMLTSDGSTLLDAAMRAGADLPFSCKGGVCSTCKAKVLEGEVEMEVNYGLEPDEVAAGYVLTCQSHPKTKRVVVSFDA